MGCDIHMYVEVKNSNGEWQLLQEPLLIDPWDLDKDPWDQRETNIPYKERNYNLFGWLAGVRRTDIVPLSEPRGVPSDASKVYRELVDHWGADGHSHSYYLLSEIDIDYGTTKLKLEGEDRETTEMPLRPMIGYVWPKCVENLRVLGGPDEVRIVFFFDN